MIFVKSLSGRTLCLDVETTDNVLSIKQKIASIEGIPTDDQRLVYAGHQLEDDECGVEKDTTLYLSLRLLGGAKKRKKKVYSTPKKNKHKKKKSKLSVLKFYDVDGEGKIKRLRKECQSSTCGGGVFMAAHENRYYCGRCHDTLVVEEKPAGGGGGGAAAKGAKGGKGKK